MKDGERYYPALSKRESYEQRTVWKENFEEIQS